MPYYIRLNIKPPLYMQKTRPQYNHWYRTNHYVWPKLFASYAEAQDYATFHSPFTNRLPTHNRGKIISYTIERTRIIH